MSSKKDNQPTFNELTDRYMQLPFSKRNFVNMMLENALNIVEKDIARDEEKEAEK